jgi:hypothetical protein
MGCLPWPTARPCGRAAKALDDASPRAIAHPLPAYLHVIVGLSWNEPWDLEGIFWLPTDDHRFYGHLRHEPDHGTLLHVVASPLMDSHGREPPSPFIPAVHGESVSGDGLSLLDVRPTSWTGGGTNTVDAIARNVVAGLPHLSDLETTAAQRVVVGLHGLREAFAGAWPYGGGVLRPRDVAGGLYDALTAELGDGATLRIEVGEMNNISRGRLQPKEYASAIFELDDGRPYAELRPHYVEPLRDFVALTTRRQSYVKRMRLSRTANEGLGWALASVPYPRPDARGARAVQALAVDLSRVDDPAPILRRWFELRERVGPVWATFFAALYGGAVLEDQFLSLAAFAEGYHRAVHDRPPLTKAEDRRAKKTMLEALSDPDVRRLYRERLSHANAQTQRDRLTELATRAVEPLGWELDIKDTVSEIIDTRNWLVHWGTRGNAVVEDPEGIVRLVRCLELVIHVNLLFDLGLDKDAVRASVGTRWRFEGLP